MSWSQTGAPQYHAQLGLQDKVRTIKEPLHLLNCLALGCYQPSSPEVLIELTILILTFQPSLDLSPVYALNSTSVLIMD